jgi:hypothetical protein
MSAAYSLASNPGFPICGRITGKPEVISGRVDLRYYFGLADHPRVE